MNEDQFRSAIAAEAKTWVNTPYHANGALKGVGVNCAQFLFCVAKNAGVLPAAAPQPRWYTPQLATNSKEERLVAYVTARALCISMASRIRSDAMAMLLRARSVI